MNVGLFSYFLVSALVFRQYTSIYICVYEYMYRVITFTQGEATQKKWPHRRKRPFYSLPAAWEAWPVASRCCIQVLYHPHLFIHFFTLKTKDIAQAPLVQIRADAEVGFFSYETIELFLVR